MPFVWSIGTICGPSIGGYFANPVENFPSTFSPHGPFGRFPYLLPNLVCAGMMLLSIVAGFFLLEETHPDMKRRDQMNTQDASAETPLIHAQAVQANTTTAAADLTHESYGTFNRVVGDIEESWNIKSDGCTSSDSPESTKVLTKRVVMLVVALALFTYHSMTYDYLLPIFFQDDRVGGDEYFVSATRPLGGGLGLSIQKVGIIISINGIIALFIQAVIFPIVTAWLGIFRVFLLVTICHPIVYIITPYLAVLPHDYLYAGIYTCLSFRNLFGILAYPTLLILIKEASPSPSSLGKINGLAASTGAACRTIASPVAGALYSIGIGLNFTAIAWWASALVALVGTIQAFFINQKKDGGHHQVRPRGLSHLLPAEDSPRNIVHIRISNDEEAHADA